MLKFLTIIFFLYALYTAMYNHAYCKSLLADVCEKVKQTIIKNNSTDFNDKDLITNVILNLGLILTFTLVLSVVEFIYLTYCIKYDPYKYVVVSYWAFLIMTIATYYFKNKNSKQTTKLQDLSINDAIKRVDNEINGMLKITLWERFRNVTALIFYVYMMYIFFIR